MILGLDTWHAYRVDWSRVAADGLRFAWVRCTEAAGIVDPGYLGSVAGAKAAGLYVGAYAPLHVSADPDAQVAHFLRHWADVGTRVGELPPALDLEVPWTWEPIGRDLVRARIVRAVQMLAEHVGRPPAIYTSSGWWRGLSDGATPEETATLAACPLWAAAYPMARPWTPPEGATMRGFGPWSRVLVWQYSGSHSVPMPGVTSSACSQSGQAGHGPCQMVDRDVWLGTEAELRDLAMMPPEPATMPGIDAPPPTLPEGVGTVDPGEGLADWAVEAHQRDRDNDT